jgi:hypothetical protein
MRGQGLGWVAITVMTLGPHRPRSNWHADRDAGNGEWQPTRAAFGASSPALSSPPNKRSLGCDASHQLLRERRLQVQAIGSTSLPHDERM